MDKSPEELAIEFEAVQAENADTEPDYRKATKEELAWANRNTPRSYRQRVRVHCPEGLVDTDCAVAFEDGTPLSNVVRIMIDLATSSCMGSEGLATALIVQFHPEIGRLVYSTALAMVGHHLVPNEDVGPPTADLAPSSEAADDKPERRQKARRDGSTAEDYEGRRHYPPGAPFDVGRRGGKKASWSGPYRRVAREERRRSPGRRLGNDRRES